MTGHMILLQDFLEPLYLSENNKSQRRQCDGNDLRQCYAVRFGDFRDHFLPEQFRRVPPPSEGIPALHNDPLFLDKRDYVVFLVIGVNFILQQCGRNRYLGQKLRQLLHIPIG